MRIARVFPRKTKATPRDEFCFFDGPGLFPPEVDEVHISVTFTWDIPRAEFLYRQWRHIAPTKLGGPAFGEPSGNFISGKYLAPGYTITSRGCPNQCWFCSVWQREPKLIELPIVDGCNVLDDNILACSENHIRSVFAMLKRQPEKVLFTGVLEARLLQDWHIDLLLEIKPKRIFFAYDTEDDYEPLVYATKKVFKAGVLSKASNGVRVYVLMGYQGDTIRQAEKRLMRVLDTGAFPMAMVMRDEFGRREPQWVKFAWPWSRPASIGALKRQAAVERHSEKTA